MTTRRRSISVLRFVALPANTSCQTYPMCGAGAETILCTVQNGTHCANYNSFMIPAVAWEILQLHPLP